LVIRNNNIFEVLFTSSVDFSIMGFTGSTFLFFFFPLFFLFYFALPSRGKNGFLVAGSLIFFAWTEKRLVLFLLISALCNYYIGRLIATKYKKSALIISLLFNLLPLFFYKYLNFTFENINAFLSQVGIHQPHLPLLTVVAPLGISFLTFRAISYSVDIYKEKITPSGNMTDFMTYFLMFPPLVAGPIVRYADISQQLAARRVSAEDVSVGTQRIVIGLIKKSLFANTFTRVADQVFSTPMAQLSSTWAWIGILAFSLQIYFDFSGYSDIAIGLARMMGFRIGENFNHPYIAKDIRDFWRRWHISLSTWLRDYIFLPLAFSLSRKWKKEYLLRLRTDRLIHIHAVLVTFAICGLWHGPTWGFFFWGVFYGIFIILESAGLGRILKKAWLPLQHFYTLMIIATGWGFFRNENLGSAFLFIAKMFSFSAGDPAMSSYLNFTCFTTEFLVIGILGVVFCTPVYQVLLNAPVFTRGNRPLLTSLLKMAISVTLFVLLILSLAYITGGTHSPFIYSRF